MDVLIHGNVHINYLTWGTPGDTPVLLIHGLQGRAVIWRSVAELLAARGFYVVAADSRGHGLSDPADDYPIELFADDAAALLETLQIAPAHVVGHSLGGAIAYTLASRRPELVRRLVIEDQPAEGTLETTATRAAWVPDWVWSFPTREAAVEFLRTHGQSVGYLMRSLVQRPDGTWGWIFERRTVVSIAHHLYERNRMEDLRRIQAPTLLIRGVDSPHLLPEVAERMIATIPDARLITLPGAHWVHVRPVPYAEAVAAFLEEGWR